MKVEDLLDPSLLQGLTDEQRREALAAAAAAKRAEEKAEQRALERAMQCKVEERQRLEREQEEQQQRTQQDSRFSRSKSSVNPSIVFVSKYKRQKTEEEKTKQTNQPSLKQPPIAASTQKVASHDEKNAVPSFTLTEKERQKVRQTYLGNSSVKSQPPNPKREKNDKKKRKSTIRTKKATFRFEWDNEDDTLDDFDPLYAKNVGVVSRASRSNKKKSSIQDAAIKSTQSLHRKPLSKMTPRDWRIFRENYEIVIKGGQAPPPLRNFREADLHHSLLDAIENVMRYREPTPIQRAAIPIQLERRDLIGIAETGSGKTVCSVLTGFIFLHLAYFPVSN